MQRSWPSLAGTISRCRPVRLSRPKQGGLQTRSQALSSRSTEATWPICFQQTRVAPPDTFAWTHELYRGPGNQPVTVLYARTRHESEEIARQFVDEPVLGFDMEWPYLIDTKESPQLQERISLIQIAAADKIALFHIGLHHGTTTDDILAPSLRKLLESPDVTKAGVAILAHDFLRLQRFFGLNPRGALELSHLYNLVTFGASDPAAVKTRLKKLTKQVEEHLGMPLKKGKVRQSDWSRPLDLAQIKYAATDAYAGFMLYHCMNAKRAAMDPAPPLPIHADAYLPILRGSDPTRSVHLGSPAGSISVVDWFRQALAGQEQCQPILDNDASASLTAAPSAAAPDPSTHFQSHNAEFNKDTRPILKSSMAVRRVRGRRRLTHTSTRSP